MTDTPYRPSSGTEGADFEEAVCWGCAGYAWTKDGTCDCDLGLLTAAFVHPIDAPGYPNEWVVRDGYPTCTAREEAS